ncbi:MAG: acyltransferase [Luteolibacter sp.]
MCIFLTAYNVIRRIRDKVASLLFAKAFHRYGTHSVLCLPVRLGGAAAIEIGSHVFIGSDCWIEVMESGRTGPGPVISIGDKTSIAGFCTITAVSRVSIGSGALIARFVHISDHSHAFGSCECAVKDQGITKIASVSIGEGAWIGHGAVICPGVTIGKNAVIGANSVVRENVPDYCVAAGVPARIIRRNEPFLVS